MIPRSATRFGVAACRHVAPLLADVRGAAAVEFAIVASLLMMLTFGILEFALAWWQWSDASAAVEAGVRLAVESDPAASYFNGSLNGTALYIGYNGVVDGGFAPGTSLVTANLPAFTVACTGSGSGSSSTVTCSCASTNAGACPPNPATTSSGTAYTTADTNAFCAIVQRMNAVFPYIRAQNVEVDYAHIGLGYAGRSGINIVPTVTVKLTDVPFNLPVLSFLSLSPTVPPITTTLTAEDLSSCSPDSSVCSPSPATCP